MGGVNVGPGRWLVAGMIAGLLVAGAPGDAASSVEFEQRVAAQGSIEQVRASWRATRTDEAAAPPDERALRGKVEDYLAKSLALDAVWGDRVAPEDLQRELERMARDTRSPRRLRELFAALGNDPRMAAEDLARPLLVERKIRERYAFDPAMHAGLRGRILAGAPGDTIEYVLDPRDEARWRVLDAVPRGRTGGLVERATYFEEETVLERSAGNLLVSRTRWDKRPFDSWWAEEAGRHRDLIVAREEPGGGYTLPAAPEAACTDDTWLPTSTAMGVPEPRQNHTAVWTGAEMIVWGGRDPSYFGTGGVYDPATDSWTPTPVGGNAPSARSWHSAVWTGTEMIVWGGDSGVFENTGAAYDPGLNSWTALPIDASTPSARAKHTAVWTGTEMIVWGGIDASGAVDSGGVYAPPPGSGAWTTTSLTNAPWPRDDHTAVWTGTEMIVWGGWDDIHDDELDSGGRYDPALDTWTATAIDANTPFERVNHTAVWTGGEMIVWGGIGFFADDSGGRYDPVGDAWTATSQGGAVPSARRWHTAVWSDGEMILWGGLGGTNTGGRYTPFLDSWVATSTSGAPAGRRNHTAVWIGPTETKMIVWGGVTSGATDTGGIYCATCARDWHPDVDLDGFGDASLPQSSCVPIPGLILDGTDCDDATGAVYPGAAQVCDGLNNDCDDPGWPGLPGTNEFDNDTDGLSTCAGDCNDADLNTWMLPGDVRDVLFGADKQTLSWTAPALPGSTALLYDTVRADTATTFDVAGTCVETDDGVDLLSSDPTPPAMSSVLYYLVRAENGCGQGPVGTDSGGVPRTAAGCP